MSPRSFPLGNSSAGDFPLSAEMYSPVAFGCCLLHGGMAMANEIFALLFQTFSFPWWKDWFWVVCEVILWRFFFDSWTASWLVHILVSAATNCLQFLCTKVLTSLNNNLKMVSFTVCLVSKENQTIYLRTCLCSRHSLEPKLEGKILSHKMSAVFSAVGLIWFSQ